MARTKHRKPETHKPGTKDILHSLEGEYQWLDLLKDKNKPYESLINIVQREGQKSEDDTSPNPSIKMIAEEINQSSAKVSQWLAQMYHDLFDLDYQSPELFKSPGTRYELHFRSNFYEQSSFFTLWLDRTLQVKDRFEWSFMNAELGASYYYIYEITHSHAKGKLTTNVFLKSGYYNGYREMLLSKSDFLELMSFDERVHLNDYEVDQILRERVEKGRDVSFERKKGRNYFKGNNW
ncbi:hypothetical protein SAMN05216490_3865 [Mucilaginibacter mallensis]|uniref:Uncharacterized protein n=1 Tax=Mucilaginibacter mallensis TaxID=652787 RepID=A0A1H2B3A7_MUCMA|nr:hypothetical protein [Mucilaginibacter mallensis]SDT52276.1 hypothetical protein SAMN05216490_3865 [Mucilaginibacter mallensis]